MKKIFLFLLCCFMGGVFASDLSDELVQQTVEGALQQIESALQNHPFGTSSVAILPLPGDVNGRLTGYLKNILTKKGIVCIEGKEDPMWDEIVKEIAWDERKDDILDPATIVKFGKLKAAQILVYGRLLKVDRNEERVFAEIELHAVDIATKRHIWGGNFAYRFYFGKGLNGVVSLDSNMRKFLQESFAEVGKNLSSPAVAGKLNSIKNILVIPLAGDVDQYMTNLAISMLSKSNLIARHPQIPSLTMAQMLGRTGQLGSDAIFYGAVRDLRVSDPEEVSTPEGVSSKVTISIDLQLMVEEAKTGNILWADTVTRETVIASDPIPVPKSFMEKYAVTGGFIIGGIILLLLVWFGVKLFVAYNTVR